MTWLDHGFALSRRSYYADLLLVPIAALAGSGRARLALSPAFLVGP